MKIIVITICLLLVGGLLALSQDWNERFPMINETPVIGILSVPLDEETTEYTSYIQSNYVKFLELGGARVIPILYNSPRDQFYQTLRYLNGVLLTGGDDDLTLPDSNLLNSYGEAVSIILEHSQKEMNAQRYFPVWGTCLGFQSMQVVLANTTDVLSPTNSLYAPLNLHFTFNSMDSRLFKRLDPELAFKVRTRPLTFNNHDDGVLLSTYSDDKFGLGLIFDILATSFDLDQVQVVAAIEHKTLPFYATAFHPEKAIFDFATGFNIPHSLEAQTFSRFLALFFVSEARRSSMRISASDVLKKKIESYPVTVLDDYMGEEYRFK